ncbi:uncharacterized protein N7477_001050 [Penicillium maclennaniae]|uniref:uncharacterized protein n=1 Tax=Penicillium maclennaniae TaxID=1343394 RepID=UPI002540B274|nr:uncharacterized protein N7477_001050 [Penicillium maclennaniae]KAJ5684705.1 hypothetical protein N7477_001050 [Penicillium maclennaniae]
MRWLSLVTLIGLALAQDTAHTTTTSDTSTTLSSTSYNLSDASTVTGTVALPSGTYVTYSSTVTLSNGDTSLEAIISSIAANATTTGNQTVVTTTSHSVTVLVGGAGTTTLGNNSMNATATTTATTTTQTPVINSRPCNGYVELCGRNYSNITNVAAHNSPFDRSGNAASNQMFDVTAQLNDGIRMLQFQVHYQNGSMWLCHTSCDILNMGTLQAYLESVAIWMRKNPYDVVTILMGNYDYVSPQNFTEPIQNSGLMDYVYTPSKIPMALHDWPTLSEMILTQKRVVFFMDYQANQTAIPWLMDEFSQIWETPFSPTDDNFPCTVQRPPGLARQGAETRMYLANHNLNLDLSFGPINLLIPNTAQLNQTNGVNGTGTTWNRPPNFLLVDYYNYGDPKNGSVFEVAAEMNNVTYNWKCCGSKSAAVHGVSISSLSTLLALVAGIQFLLTAI